MTETSQKNNSDAPLGFEDRLVQNLQPIRGFALAMSLYHLFDLGIADAILSEPAQPISSLAKKLDLDAIRLEGFLLFFQVEGFVKIDEDTVHPLDNLSEMREAWPWYEMLIGGYAETYLNLGKGLLVESPPLSRDGSRVGAGSCKISHYDAIPLTKQLLNYLPRDPMKIIDLGCGNALYLHELCSLFPDLIAVGVEPDEGSHTQSTADVQNGKQRERIKLYNSTAQDFINGAYEDNADAIIVAFVLQEILGQDGRQGVISFLKGIASKYPDTHIIIIEVDNMIKDLGAMSHPLAKSYYNPYFLVHYFTNQVLEVESFWTKLFKEAGFQITARSTTNPTVDSTGFELGFLLKCA